MMKDATPSVSGMPRLKLNEVHVWSVNIGAWEPHLETLCAILSKEEHAHASRISLESRRQRFAITRALLKLVLGSYLDTAAASVRIEYGLHGKPRLADAGQSQRLTFNLTHSKDLALYAVSHGREVGIDVEYVRRDFDWRRIAARCFPPAEWLMLRRISSARRCEAFFRCWTHKEAILKASGRGLLQAWGEYPTIPHLSSESPSPPDAVSPAGRWSLRDINVPPGYVATLAVEGARCQIIPRESLWTPVREKVGSPPVHERQRSLLASGIL